MAGKPRIYLFYGSDTRASLQAVSRWRKLFEAKHGASASFCLEADELDSGLFSRELEGALQGDTLFQEPRLVVVRRLTAQEKGNSTPYTKALLRVLERPETREDEGLTLAVWEERDLPSTHALVQFFAGLEKEGRAKVYRFSVPAPQGLLAAARAQLARYGLELAPEAGRWLSQQHAWIERRARLERRLKPADVWPDDYRGWWLYQLLEGAALRSRGPVVSLEDLVAGHRDFGEPVGAFDIADAVGSGDWKRARSLMAALERESQGAGDYFSLFAALRWRLQRRTGLRAGLADYAVRLLGEAELIAKNGIPEPSWLFALLLLRLENASREGAEQAPLVPYRALWLSQLSRSV